MVTDTEFITSTRAEFISRLKETGVFIIFAGTPKPVTSDDDYRFFGDLNFRYLTGLDNEDMIYAVRKTAQDASEMIFAPEKDPLKERWHGARMSPEEIREKTGIDQIKDREDFEAWLLDRVHEGETIYTDLTSVTKEVEGLQALTGQKPKDISQVLTEMRLIKSPYEISCIREAAKITEDAVGSLKEYVREGVSEYELCTRLEYELARRSDPTFAFATIVAVGENSFCLHHSRADRDMKVTKGGYIQIDCGARVNGYSADISRVIFCGGARPGEDTSDKRYVLHGMIKELRKKAQEFIRPGVSFEELNALMRESLGAMLSTEGLAKEDESPADCAKRYYWHNTSHFLGLNVHDVGGRDRKFEAGMTLAVEPGVYIPEWDVGFRIEDDVLVTDGGCEYLSSGNDDIEEAYVCI